VGGKGGAGGRREEMTQALYAHMNNKKKKLHCSRAPVAHSCNPSYLGGRDQQDGGLKASPGK
jgi:hypothetical protein